MASRTRPGPPAGGAQDGRSRLIARAVLSLAAIAVLGVSHPARAAVFSSIPAVTAAKPDALAVEDPLEGLNRRFYAIHRGIDRALFKPLAMGYAHVLPHPLRIVLHNLVTELGEPVVFGNDVLQLRLAKAAGTAARLVTNATVGIGGLLDPATRIGLPHHDNGFGITLGRYGMAPGPYIFLPLIGPSTLRDLIGKAVDFYSDPISRVHYHDRGDVQVGIWVTGGLDQRVNAESDLEQIDQMGTDSYATMRSLYLQDRQSAIRGGAPVSINDLPQFDDTPAPPPARPAPSSAPAASDPAASKPSYAAVKGGALLLSGPDAAYFLAPPAPAAAPAPGPPLGL